MSGRFSNTSAKPRSPRQLAELGPGVGDRRRSGRRRRPAAQAHSRWLRVSIVEPDFDDARCSVRSGGHASPMRAIAAGSVVSSTCELRAAGRRLEGAGEHLGEQARAAHAHARRTCVDAVDQRVARARRARAGRPRTSPTHRDPAEPVGDLGGVVAARACGRRRTGGATASRSTRSASGVVDRVGERSERSCERTRRAYPTCGGAARAASPISSIDRRRCGPGPGTAPRRRRGRAPRRGRAWRGRSAA